MADPARRQSDGVVGASEDLADARPVEVVVTACTVDAHAGRVTRRSLTASTALCGYSDWPGLQQGLMIERRTLHKATRRVLRQEIAYTVTSCPPARATPAQLLRLWRDHWGIENRLHNIRDVTFDEDRATARADHALQVMAAFRNAAIGLIRALGTTAVTAACRRFAAEPLTAFRALGTRADFK